MTENDDDSLLTPLTEEELEDLLNEFDLLADIIFEDYL